MACSKNIGELAYHNFVTGDDYIKICYDKTKADQEGEKIRDKHIYAKSLNPLVCPFLALGVWFAMEAKRLGSTTSLFVSENVGVNAPGNKYIAALSQLLQNNIEASRRIYWKRYADAHGVRKRFRVVCNKWNDLSTFCCISY